MPTGATHHYNLQSRPHAASVGRKVGKVRNNDAAVDGVMALKTYALAATLRSYIGDGVIIDSEVDLAADKTGKTHSCSLIFGDIASAAASVLVVSVDEVERAEEVACVELLVELVSLSDARRKESVKQVVQQCHAAVS